LNTDLYFNALGSWPINIHARLFLTYSLYGLSIFIFIKFIQESRKRAVVSTQETIADNIQEMINSIKGQRHDFLNHLHVINMLCSRDNLEPVKEYVQEIVQESVKYNELLKFDNIVLSALINAKIAQANDRGINMKLDIQSAFSGVSHLSIDLSRILGNLLDNAMDYIANTGGEKTIGLKIYEKGPFVCVSVSNPWMGDQKEINEIINRGISTKGYGHQGLGIKICRQLARKIHGKLDYSFDPEEGLSFLLMVPADIDTKLGNSSIL
jgi:two-component system, LytTR family, sensor histidine kinase AgrC